MRRQPVYRYTDPRDVYAEPVASDGWIDLDESVSYLEGTHSVRGVPYSLITHTELAHEMLYRTTGGRWVIRGWTDWDETDERPLAATADRWWEMTARQAREWLIRSAYDEEDVDAATGVPGPEERERAVGLDVTLALPAEVLTAVEARASAAGTTITDVLSDLVRTHVDV